MSDLLLFHWAPTSRRKQIIRYGLMPSCRGTVAPDPAWRAPWVCLSPSPSLAWALSVDQRRDIDSWDLWQVWKNALGACRIRREEGRILEVRTPQRIYKRHVWYVGTRKGTS